jgi:DNA-directed RNA polymerase specialized sigma24 family protein
VGSADDAEDVAQEAFVRLLGEQTAPHATSLETVDEA